MEDKIFLIYDDDTCNIRGYIKGTEEDADKYCENLNKDNKHEWEDICWEELECLNV